MQTLAVETHQRTYTPCRIGLGLGECQQGGNARDNGYDESVERPTENNSSAASHVCIQADFCGRSPPIFPCEQAESCGRRPKLFFKHFQLLSVEMANLLGGLSAL